MRELVFPLYVERPSPKLILSPNLYCYFLWHSFPSSPNGTRRWPSNLAQLGQLIRDSPKTTSHPSCCQQLSRRQDSIGCAIYAQLPGFSDLIQAPRKVI